MNQWTAVVRVPYPGHMTLNDIDAMIEKVRETAHPMPEGRSVVITWRADNEWDLRGQVAETLNDLEAEFSGLSRSLDSVELIEKVTRYQGEARPFA